MLYYYQGRTQGQEEGGSPKAEGEAGEGALRAESKVRSLHEQNLKLQVQLDEWTEHFEGLEHFLGGLPLEPEKLRLLAAGDDERREAWELLDAGMQQLMEGRAALLESRTWVPIPEASQLPRPSLAERLEQECFDEADAWLEKRTEEWEVAKQAQLEAAALAEEAERQAVMIIHMLYTYI